MNTIMYFFFLYELIIKAIIMVYEIKSLYKCLFLLYDFTLFKIYLHCLNIIIIDYIFKT